MTKTTTEKTRTKLITDCASTTTVEVELRFAVFVAARQSLIPGGAGQQDDQRYGPGRDHRDPAPEGRGDGDRTDRFGHGCSAGSRVAGRSAGIARIATLARRVAGRLLTRVTALARIRVLRLIGVRRRVLAGARVGRLAGIARRPGWIPSRTPALTGCGVAGLAARVPGGSGRRSGRVRVARSTGLLPGGLAGGFARVVRLVRCAHGGNGSAQHGHRSAPGAWRAGR